jgi:membrane protein
VLIVSTVVSSMLSMVLSSTGPVWDIANELLAMAIFSGLFAVLFRYVPDSRLPWRYALEGGFATAVLFGIGKWVIGAYLARGNVGGAYGGAGSLVVVLVWTYYSAAVFFFAAELLQAWVEAIGDVVAPNARTHDRSEYVDAPTITDASSEQSGKPPT